MRYHTSGCLLCGGDICYSEAAAPQTCALCGTMHEANATCENGHFICDGCHAQAGLEAITQAAMAATERDPIRIAVDMMASPFVHMHGPEHHFLVAAALLAAYRNAGGDIDIAASLCAAKHRAAQVPGGICGMWGCCGAGVSSDIFVSVITKAKPMSTESWSLAN